jgi:hypothetical protein
MSNDKRIGFRDVVQTLYYREILQNDFNLNVINKNMAKDESFNSWDNFLSQPQEFIAQILSNCESQLDCEVQGQDDIGYRQGGYPIDIIQWDGDNDLSMFRARKIN